MVVTETRRKRGKEEEQKGGKEQPYSGGQREERGHNKDQDPKRGAAPDRTKQGDLD